MPMCKQGKTGPLSTPVSCAVHPTMSRFVIDPHLQSSSDDERQVIGSWLSSLNFQASQNEFIQKRRRGTGEWFLESREFKEWRDGTSEMLWCPGDGKIGFVTRSHVLTGQWTAGAGKTILA